MTNINQEDDVLFSRSAILMNEVSHEVASLARKNLASLLHAIGVVGQVRVADRMVVHEATVSRMKTSGELARVALILAASGIELPSSTQRIYPVDVVEALRTLANANLKCLETETEKLGISGN